MTAAKNGTSSRTAFTLIELLVVIAIIAILAAILFPVFAQAREKARQITSASNEKQILLGIMQYTQDYDEMLPRIQTDAYHANGTPWSWDGNANTDDQWFGLENAVDPYIKAGSTWGPETSGNVWHDPDDSYKRDDCDGAPGIGVGYDISYAFTPYGGPTSTTQFGVFSPGDYNDPAASNLPASNPNKIYDSLTVGQIQEPSDTIIMYEQWDAENYARFVASSRSDMGSLEDYMYAYPDTLNIGDQCGDGYQWLFTLGTHDGFTEDGYADGHVKANPTHLGADGYHHPNWFTDVTGEWNGKAPNAMHWDAQYH
jgi:prepilin-type N-terminal cleavage/methylation domain-containing protein